MRPIREATKQLTVDHLLDGVQQLTPAELWEFTERLAEWQRQREIPDEAPLLASIRENSRLPEDEQRKYQELWRKCEDETLSEAELTEYQKLLGKLEARNLKRIEALNALAQMRGKTLRQIMADLGYMDRAIQCSQNSQIRENPRFRQLKIEYL